MKKKSLLSVLPPSLGLGDAVHSADVYLHGGKGRGCIEDSKGPTGVLCLAELQVYWAGGMGHMNLAGVACVQLQISVPAQP